MYELHIKLRATLQLRMNFVSSTSEMSERKFCDGHETKLALVVVDTQQAGVPAAAAKALCLVFTLLLDVRGNFVFQNHQCRSPASELEPDVRFSHGMNSSSLTLYTRFEWSWTTGRSQWRSQPKMFDFTRATVFCLGYRLSKHKMTRYAKNLGGHGPLATSMVYHTAVLLRSASTENWNRIRPLRSFVSLRWSSFFGWHIKGLINLKMLVQRFGIRKGISPEQRTCLNPAFSLWCFLQPATSGKWESNKATCVVWLNILQRGSCQAGWKWACWKSICNISSVLKKMIVSPTNSDK